MCLPRQDRQTQTHERCHGANAIQPVYHCGLFVTF
jgi:hypothetical protein